MIRLFIAMLYWRYMRYNSMIWTDQELKTYMDKAYQNLIEGGAK